MQKLNQTIARQKGAVLILLAFIIGLGVLAYLLHAFDPARLRLEQDKKTYQTLNEAKQALIAWAVSHPNTPGLMPYPDRKGDGNYDDTSDCYISTVNFNYLFTLGRLPLFRNDPFCINPKNNVVNGVSGDFRDSAGERLWYEVSKNLLHDYKDNGGNPNGTSPIINPGIVNNPAYPWFTVRDRSGTVITSRVAAVIIAPGEPIGGQDRSGGIADPNQYLDKITMADNTVYQNYNYPTSDINVKEFIIGENFKTVAKNDPTYKNQSIEPYYFNDRLVYITIDELMAAVEKRVGEVVRSSLKTYQDTNGYYPYAAQLGTNVMYSGSQNLKSGFLPVNPQNCSYNTSPLSIPISSTRVAGSQNLTTLASFAAVSKDWSVTGTGIPSGTTVLSVTNANQLVLSSAVTASGTIILTFNQPTMECSQLLFDNAAFAVSSIAEVRFYLPSGTFTSSSLSCTMQSGNTRCYCTGAGSCSNATTTFSCNLSSCNAAGAGAAGDIRIRGGKLTSSSGGCIITTPITKNAATNCPITTTSRITCNSANGSFAAHSNGDIPFDAFLPNWFNQYQWGNFVYYEMTRPASTTIIVGNKTTEASVIMVGHAIDSLPFATSKGAIQTRPSCNTLNNYLDSVENVSVNAPNNIYDATSTLRSSNYNDQTFLVAP
jgi:hypothetical protein